MPKPVLLTVDDDPEVLRAIERDLRTRYADRYRVMRANSGDSALTTLRELKILVDRDSRQILGASILGVGGDEVIHAVLDLMYAKAPYTVMQRAVHIHPTVSELLPTMLGDLKLLA